MILLKIQKTGKMATQGKGKFPSPTLNNLKLSEEQLVQSHGIDVLAVLVNTHVAGSNFVDEHDIAVGIVAELELDVVQLHALGSQIVSDDLGDGLGLSLQILILLVGHNADGNQSILGDQGIALGIVLRVVST